MSYTAVAKYIKKSKSFEKKWVERYKANKTVDDLPERGKSRATASKCGFGCLELFTENLNAQKMLQIYERGLENRLENRKWHHNFGLAITVSRCESNRKCLECFKEEA